MSDGARGGHPGPSTSRPALALLAALWAAVAAPAFLGSALWFRDLLIYSYPQKRHAAARLLAGEFPVWSDDFGTGRPFFGLVQPGVLDPLNALLLVPGALGVDLFNLAHLAVAGLGARAWIRALDADADDRDACAAAALVGLSGYLVSMVATNGTYAWGVAFAPWSLAILARGARLEGAAAVARHAAALGVTLALALFAGDPQAVIFAGLACAAQALGEPTAATRARALTILGVGAVFGGALGAVQLLPAAAVARTYRGEGVSLRNASNFSMPPLRLVELLAPTALGEPYAPGWRGPALYTRSARQTLLPFAIGIHQSVALLPLALAALNRRARLDRALWALAVVGLVLAMGIHTPVWPWLFEHVPGLRTFRNPEKYLALATLALAALAARGLPVARAHPALATRAALVLAAALGVGAGLATRADPAGNLAHLAPALGRSAIVALVFAAAYRAAGVTAVPRALREALPALVMGCELLAASLPLIPWARADVVGAAPTLLAAIAQDRGGSARGARVFRDLAMPMWANGAAEVVASLAPNLGFDAGLGHLDAYDAFPATRVRGLRHEVRRSPAELLRWWGVEYAVASPRDPEVPGLRAIAAVPAMGLRLLRVEGAAPRVYLARDTVAVHGPAEALAAARAPGFAPGAHATVEGPRRASEGRCAVLVQRHGERTMRCDATAPAWLIVGESFDPSWVATVNGAAVDVVRGNEIYLAVPVPAGASTVTLRVRPKGLRGGAAASLAALAMVVAVWAWGARRRR